MFSIKNLIDKVFGGYFIINDSYKDINGKGLNQRFHEMLGDDIDTNILPLIKDLQKNTIDPQNVIPKYFYYLEQMLGGVVNIKNDIALRRKLMQYSSAIYGLRGTKKSYEILLKLLGFTDIVITQIFDDVGFDTWPDGGSFDNGTFDSSCPNCSSYTLELTGDVEITPEVNQAIFNIIEFCEPIDTHLLELKINGTNLSKNAVSIDINIDGDLNYDNGNDPFTELFISSGGDLLVSGPRSGSYSIDENGDLIFTS